MAENKSCTDSKEIDKSKPHEESSNKWRATYVFIAQEHRRPSKIALTCATQRYGGKLTFHSTDLKKLIHTKILRAVSPGTLLTAQSKP